MDIFNLEEGCSFTDILKTRKECLFVTAFVITREYGSEENSGLLHLTPLETVVIQDVAGAINEIVESEVELPCFAYLNQKYSSKIVNGEQGVWIEVTQEPFVAYS